jgi:DMSO/TMAO reductase YedYZ molybdopterin-dependent catalytic subunit
MRTPARRGPAAGRAESRERRWNVGIVTPGFEGRRRESAARLPPGQYLTGDFPVLSAGPTPRIALDQWEFVITTETGQARRWSWSDLQALPSETPTLDIHCVTKWSKLDTNWEGVSLDTLMSDVDTTADFALAHSYGGYHEPAARGPADGKAGSPTGTTASTCLPSTVDQPASWCHISTSGSRRSGSAGSS